jgi:hypothetical protein
MIVAKGQTALAKCESELRALLAQAASSGDYDAVIKLTSWARAIAGLMSGTPTSVTEGSKAAPKRKASGTAYPRFERRGDSLVKIGWSKREKTEYEHKAPMGAVALVADKVRKKGADGRIFQISGLLPCESTDGETIVPDYQVYLVVAWWRELGLLEQHGRQGYSLPKPSDFAKSVEQASTQLIQV